MRREILQQTTAQCKEGSNNGIFLNSKRKERKSHCFGFVTDLCLKKRPVNQKWWRCIISQMSRYWRISLEVFWIPQTHRGAGWFPKGGVRKYHILLLTLLDDTGKATSPLWKDFGGSVWQRLLLFVGAQLRSAETLGHEAEHCQEN